MGRANHLVLGDHNVVCFQCGFKRKASTLEKNWQGYWVCPEHNEPRQVQDFVRGIPDNMSVPWSQPTPQIVYTYTDEPIGFGNGANKSFQLGSGLYTVNVTEVKINSTVAPGFLYSVNATGLITFSAVTPARGDRIYASGTEVVP